MPTYTLDKYDFKKFLLAELTDTRQEELIFWKKTIPMPVDLIYGIFEKRGELLGLYLNHIGAACLFAWACEQEGYNWVSELEAQPTKDNKSRLPELQRLLHRHAQNSGVLPMLQQLAEQLGLQQYSPTPVTLSEALCHEGRKYKRLYLPPSMRSVIQEIFPQILNHIARSNWDMFSNVVADTLHVYRMGFADAFSGIFNKLLDFILRYSTPGRTNGGSASGISIRQQDSSSVSEPRSQYGQVNDGSIWEPRYINATTTLVLNERHPFWELVRRTGKESESIMIKLLAALAEQENETVRDADRRVIEVMRQDISRRLRLQAEESAL